MYETVRRLLPVIGAEGIGNVVAAAMLTQADQCRRIIETSRKKKTIIDEVGEGLTAMEEQEQVYEINTPETVQEESEYIMDQTTGSTDVKRKKTLQDTY